MTPATTENLFTSLSAVRAEHRELQREYRTQGNTPAVLERIEDFILRGRKIGQILDDEEDQAAVQALLDLWGAALYRAGRPVPETNLLPFDKDAAPILDDRLVPYVGPDAFEESKKDIFFGRQGLVASLVERVTHRNLLAISGPSGSGKSSLVLAGIVPALKNGALPGSAGWRYLGRMVPGSNPFENLSKLLLRGHENANGAVQALAEQLEKKPDSLREIAAGESQATAVLVIDQFEELSTLCEDTDVREAFEKALVSFVRDDGTGRHLLLLTMRSDFMSAVARLPEFQKLLETALVPVTPLSAAELREAITRPAECIGLKFEPGVVDSLVHDTLGEPAALPLLQFTLLKLWEHRDHNRITLQAYRELGGGRLALTRSADKFINSLIPQERIMAERILLRLVRPGIGQDYVANRIRKVSLYSIGPKENVDRVLNKLVEQHFVRLTQADTEADSEVEVAHEALIRNWQHLVSLLEAERERMTTLRRLELKAGEWVRLGRGTAGLLRDAALVEAEQWLASPDSASLGASNNVHLLVNASRAAANAARKRSSIVRVALVVLAAASVVFAIGSIKYAHEAKEGAAEAEKQTRLATINWNKAEDQRQVAENLNTRLQDVNVDLQDALKDAKSAEARSESDARLYEADKLADDTDDALADDPERAVLLAVRSSVLLSTHKQALTPGIESSVYRAAQSNRLRVVLPTSNRVTGMAFSPDGCRLVTAEAGQPIRLWDANTGKLLLTFAQSSGASALAFSLDNRQIAAAFGSKVNIFDAVSGQLKQTLDTHIATMRRLLFSPDGSYLVGIGAGGGPEVWKLGSESGSLTLKSPGGQREKASAVAVSPTGQVILTGDDTSIRVWDAQSGSLLREFPEHDRPITILAFHPDGVHFASVTDDGVIRFWTLAPVVGVHTATYKFGFSSASPTYGGAVIGINFSMDGQRFTSVAEDGTVNVWSVESGRAMDQFPVRPLTTVAFNLDGSKLAGHAEGSSLGIWDASPGLGQVIGRHNGPISDLTESLSDKTMTVSTTDGVVRGWDLSKPGQEFAFEDRIAAPSAAWGSETALGYSEDLNRVVAGTKKGFVYLTDGEGADGKPFTPSLDVPISAVGLTPDGKGVAVVASDGSIYSGDLSNLKLTQLPIRFKVNDIAFSHDGKYLATAGEDRTVKLWSWNSLPSGGDSTLMLRGHAGAVTSVTFSKDDKLLASSSSDGVVKVWSIAGRDVGANILSFNTGSAVASRVRFVHDDTGILVAAQDGVLRMFPLMIHNQVPIILASLTRDFRPGECRGDCSSLQSFIQHIVEANQLTKLGDTANALAKLELAQTSMPGLPINAQEEIRLVQQQASGEAARQATRGYVAEVTALARAQLTDEAAEVMKKLGEHDASTVKLNDLSSQAEAATAGVFRSVAPDVAQNGDENLVKILFTRVQSLTDPATQSKADPELQLRDFMADAYLRAAQMQVNSKKDIDRVLSLFDKARQYSQKSISLQQVGTNDWLNSELCKKAGTGIGDLVKDPKFSGACEAAAQSALGSHHIEETLGWIARARKNAQGPTSLDSNAVFNNELCWQGSISDGTFFKDPEVIASCQRAATLSHNSPAFLDSRAVNRARNGDHQGAIEDFRPYATDPKTPQDRRAAREGWISLLQKGQDPFTPDVLKQMQRGW